jgi:ABC-2 type transport system permease protein
MKDMEDMTLREVLFSFEGRIGRRTFWLLGVLPICVFLLIGAAVGLFSWAVTRTDAFVLPIVLQFCCFALLPALAVQIKRCHDRNHSGFFMFLILAPVVYWILVDLYQLVFGLGSAHPGLFALLEAVSHAGPIWYLVELFFFFLLPGPAAYWILLGLHALACRLGPIDPRWLLGLSIISYAGPVWYLVEVGLLWGTAGENRYGRRAGNTETITAVLGVYLVGIITFCAISVCQNIEKAQVLGKELKADVTEQKIYTLSEGSESILARLNQPIKARLYYAKTAALKGPDQIRYFNNYYEFVKALLEEYVAVSKGMVELEIIDPMPFSDEEEQAIRYGLRRFPITEEENFFFGLVVQTQFGVEKVIPFFSPDRQNFVEYDISYLIDTAVTRQKKKLGIMSSLPVMGDDVTGYMAEMMRRQGQQPKPAWTIVEQLRRKYEVSKVETDIKDVNDMNDLDVLLVIHPKELPEPALFAIDQFVLQGKEAIVCVDPHCFADTPDRMAMQMGRPPTQNSDLNVLLRNWGVEMPENTFAGDRKLAISAPIRANSRPERIIGYLELTPECFNSDNVITTQLNQVRILFSGVLREVAPPAPKAKEQGADQNEPNEPKLEQIPVELERTPLIMTTNRGNTFSISSPYELMMLDASRLMGKFLDGEKPVNMGYKITGRFRSAFPDGIDIEEEQADTSAAEPNDANEPKKVKVHKSGLAQAAQKCAVVVFADVDFISDQLAYQSAFFGKIVVGDNSAVMLNTIEDLCGSSDLVSIRSRGNLRRPFVVVDEIERQAEAESAAEVAKIEAEIAGFNTELQQILASAKEGQEEVVGSSIMQKKRELELKIHQAEREKRRVNLTRRQRIDKLGTTLRNANMWTVPVVILVIAVVLGVRRSVRKRHYISHASDA